MFLDIIVCRERILLEDYVICRMPSVAGRGVGLVTSEDGVDRVVETAASPWSLGLPLVLVTGLLLVILYNVSCSLNCSSYLSNMHTAAKLEAETAV